MASIMNPNQIQSTMGLTAMLKIVVNPIVDWIWFGFMMLAIGTAITLLPEALLEKITARVPERDRTGARAASGTALLLALVAGGGLLFLAPSATAWAANDMKTAPGEPPSPVGPDENWLVRNIICQCGSCRHNLLECASENCGHAAQDRIEIHELLGQGRTRDDIIQYFIQKYGSEVALAAPIDKGFNRLAWALPYGLGVGAAGVLAFGAVRLARRSGGASPADAGATASTTPLASATPSSQEVAAAAATSNPELKDQLEDELQSLD